MPDIRTHDVDKHVRSGHPSKVYLIYGDDSYQKDTAARKLIEGLKPQMLPDINYRRFIGERDTLSAVCEACVQLPMMDNWRLTVMEDFPTDRMNSQDAAMLSECIDRLESWCVLVIWQNDAEFDARKSGANALIQQVRKRGSVLRCDVPSANDAARMLCESADEMGARLSMADAIYMVRRCGRDMTLLSGELEKLAIYAGKKTISQQMIDEVCPATLEADVYQISKSILRGRAEDALKVTGNLLSQKAKPVEIFGVLSQSFTDLYRAKCAAAAGMDAEQLKKAFTNDYPRSRAFRADNAMRDQRDYSLHQLRRYVELLISAELALKGGRNDKRTCLEQLIIRLCSVRKGGLG